MGYDYIGGPIYSPGSHWPGFKNSMRPIVGNGGLSLRKISMMLKLTDPNGYLYNKYMDKWNSVEYEDMFICDVLAHDIHIEAEIAVAGHRRIDHDIIDKAVAADTEDRRRGACRLIEIALCIDRGDIRTGFDMCLDCRSEINIRDDIAVGQNDVFRGSVLNEAPDIAERIELAVIDGRAGVAVRREQMQTALFACEIPFSAGADMVEQRAVIAFGDDTDLRDAGIDKIRERKVDQPVSAAERHRAHCTVLCEIENYFIMDTGEDQSHYILIDSH